MGPIGLTESAAFLLGLSLGFPWIGAKLVILVVVIRLAIHADRVRTRARATQDKRDEGLKRAAD
jgi:hypothetical protein